jgi:aerotaxis receptor
MRLNHPVTGKQYPFPPGVTLVSVTDAQGRITYCNDAFVSVSGFSREELMGQPHNLVRHPDMPPEAFRDMWATLEEGLPWTALVKNRRKDGDHYWVRANVTPMLAEGRLLGYLSVRSEPTAQEIAEAQALYTRMNEQAAAGGLRVGLHRGRVVRLGLAGRLQRLWQPSVDQLGGAALLPPLLALPALAVGAASLPVAAQVGAGLVLALALGWWRERGVRHGIEQVLHDAQQLAACDLSHQPALGSRGPLGRLQLALVQLAVNLRTAVGDSRQGVERVRHSMDEIAAGNHDLSARTESQAASLEQTAASMDQITGTIRQSAEALQRGARLAADSAGMAEGCAQAVGQVEATMGEIRRASAQMNEMIAVIEGVAFRTNILALNAAVEAARAGEAGRGFAVVAGEVRALASRAAEAARQIRSQIQESASRVETGVDHVGEARRRMDEALYAVREVSQALQELEHTNAEQARGVSQVNEAVSQLDGITQQNAAMVEELAATASSVCTQTEAVAGTMRMFRLTPGDSSPAQVDAVALRKAQRDAAHAG